MNEPKRFLVYFAGKAEVESDSRNGAKLLLLDQMQSLGMIVAVTRTKRIEEKGNVQIPSYKRRKKGGKRKTVVVDEHSRSKPQR